MTSNPTHAQNAVSFGNDDGLGFVAERPRTGRTVRLNLRYRVDRLLADGVLFAPGAMEDKWAVFFHRNELFIVRSWSREVHLRSQSECDGDWLVFTDAVGAINDDREPAEFTRAAVDFIVRSHAMSEVLPAPLPADIGDDVAEAERMALSLYGNRAQFATTQMLQLGASSEVLRSNSLFHISVARGDLDAVEQQVLAGVPLDLLARDGRSALHWSLHRPDTDALEWLVKRGLHVDTRARDGETTLMGATQLSDKAKMAWLLEHGADPNACDARGFTSLHRAAEVGMYDGVRLLLSAGAELSPVAQGHTPLSLALLKDHRDLLGLLLPGTGA